MKKFMQCLFIIACALAVSACTGNEEVKKKHDNEEAVPVSSQLKPVDLIDREGNKIGAVTLKETTEGVSLHVEAEGLEPGKKAIHIHETGKCERPDFSSAEGHFNPQQKQHGFNNPKGFHAGDLPNIEVSEKGTVNVEITAPNVTLRTGEPHSLFDADGSAIVIHENADDYKTDPAGNAGDRIVCGAIVAN